MEAHNITWRKLWLKNKLWESKTSYTWAKYLSRVYFGDDTDDGCWAILHWKDRTRSIVFLKEYDGSSELNFPDTYYFKNYVTRIMFKRGKICCKKKTCGKCVSDKRHIEQIVDQIKNVQYYLK
jgi:hypothetical protein